MEGTCRDSFRQVVCQEQKAIHESRKLNGIELFRIKVSLVFNQLLEKLRMKVNKREHLESYTRSSVYTCSLARKENFSSYGRVLPRNR